MAAHKFAQVIAADRAKKTGRAYIAYQVRNGQWMVDPFTADHKHGDRYEIFSPEPDPVNEQVIKDSVESSSLFMNKHHAALDTISEALTLLNNGKIKEAYASLADFVRDYDQEVEETD